MNISTTFSATEQQKYYDLVQEEWQEDFFKIQQKFSPSIILGKENGVVVAGGALFTGTVPEEEDVVMMAKKHIPDHVPYFGYFVIDKTLRGHGMGSAFLQLMANQDFWIAILNPDLQEFYERNGCTYIGTVGENMLFLHKGR